MTPAPEPLKRQQSLPLEQSRAPARSNFIVSASNASAVAALDAWRDWPGGKLALVGPQASGKSHLASAWAAQVGARQVRGDALASLGVMSPGPLLIEDVDRAVGETALLALIDAADQGSPLLMTGRQPPRSWPTELPDLTSRLAALMVAELQTPDDVVLGGLLRQFFRERNIVPRKGVIEFLLRRIERSAPAARAVVERMDEAAAAENRSVTRDLAREILGDEPPDHDLFDDTPD